MFLKESNLVALMKTAYKSDGLIVFRLNEETLYLAGNYWRLECKMPFIPRKIIAAIYELTGEIPEHNGFRATKDGNQEYMELAIRNGINTNPFREEVKLSRTLQIGKAGTVQRLLQSPDTGKVYVVKESHLAAVDADKVLHDKGETYPEGPYTDGTSGILYWNNVCRYMCWFRSDEENDVILKAIEGSDIIGEAI